MAQVNKTEITKNLKLAEAKRALFFSQVQSTYQLSTKLTTDRTTEMFLVKARQLDQLRLDYIDIIDKINLLNLELNENFVVNYKSLDAFDDMYYPIKTILASLDVTVTSKLPSPSHEYKHEIKVPKIALPTFDGEIENFPFFYETFKRIIHNNKQLSDSERIHHLMGHLSGRAKNVCAGLVPSAENYTVVWNALIDKYHDKRALATSYLNQLFSLKSINGPSAVNLERTIDKFSSLIAALKQLKINDLSDFIFVHIGLKLLDSDTAKCFETSIRGSSDMPDYNEFVKFIREHVKILYRTNNRTGSVSGPATAAPAASARVTQHAAAVRAPRAYFTANAAPPAPAFVSAPALSVPCSLCKELSPSQSHLYKCKQFIALAPFDRYKFIRNNRWCSNCLSSRHFTTKCNSSSSCRKCNMKHHTLLHFGDNLPQPTVPTANVALTDGQGTSSEGVSKPSVNDVVTCSLSSTQVIVPSPIAHASTEVLATAKVYATGRNGRDVMIRCLLDPGSQKHYITTKCCTKLGLNVTRSKPIIVKGIGGASQVIKGSVNLTFKSRFNTKNNFNIQPLVLNQITCSLPTSYVDATSFVKFKDIPLADETWDTPGEIDLLIGVNLFVEMLLSGKIVNPPGAPDALETVLGYIVLGEAPTLASASTSLALFTTVSCNVESLVKRFWEIEEVETKSILNIDDKHCEEFYTATTTRDSTGKYSVALPFKYGTDLLGNSYDVAKRRFLCLERKFTNQPRLKTLYDDVMQDYIDKSYLSPVNCTQEQIARGYFIPHHPVVREDKSSTKVRPVLDASAKSHNGFSLNDILHAGPNLQRDLFTILLNLRLFAVALSADVKQMYLRIEVRQEDRCFQRILYRFRPDDPLQVFEFNSVAFGLRCSPYLALRTISQLADDEGDRFPIAKEIVKRDLYMDDIATSVMHYEHAVSVSQDLINLFAKGDFQLIKWSSNCRDVLNKIPVDYRLSQNVEFDNNDTLKILGLCWDPNNDVFLFKVTSDDRPCTKRNILSSVARLFDVLGLVAPVILYAKLLIKELWIVKLDWDETPSQHIIKLWSQFQNELPLISNLYFPRHLGVVHQCSVTVLGFADASERAYGGVVYVHVTNLQGSSQVTLVCAKSKVAPLKVISLARLELCAALILSQLIKRVCETYETRYTINSIYAFSDSTVTLNWIHSSPHRWQTFVANRVSKIQDNLKPEHFYYIKGNENPSDCLSRGLTPAQLVNHPLWLHGPPWASLSKAEWPVKPFINCDNSDVPEMKPVSLMTVAPAEPYLCELSRRFSSWSRFIRTVCYIFKFIKKLPLGQVTGSDLEFAESEIIRHVQLKHFSEELNNLIKGSPSSKPINKLNPFIKNNVIRVGGRLVNSDEDYNYKHPALLPGREHIVELLITHYHIRNLHTGPALLMSILRTRYWILAARRVIRSIISKCNVCFRFKPRSTNPIMASLPEVRVKEMQKAFLHTGCDFAGPFYITPYRSRGIRSHKAYVCLFTCLTTRCVHIELTSEMSTTCFLAALKRFLARRGPVQCLYSDHGTNFIGARSYLRELYTFLANEYDVPFKAELAENRIQWKLIPPNAPHFGGCWESNVKCIKSHLYKVIGSQVLTFEELLTILTQIECLLNSRPLTVLSSDPSELEALTPSHFLNTTPLKMLPALYKLEEFPNLLKRYELLDQFVRSFWKRWRGEYLHTLQIRQKWNTPAFPVKEGMVVVVMQDNVMPLQWPLGIIVGTYKGKDGVIRVAQVKTKSGIFQRPVVKLCPLPSQ